MSEVSHNTVVSVVLLQKDLEARGVINAHDTVYVKRFRVS